MFSIRTPMSCPLARQLPHERTHSSGHTKSAAEQAVRGDGRKRAACDTLLATLVGRPSTAAFARRGGHAGNDPATEKSLSANVIQCLVVTVAVLTALLDAAAQSSSRTPLVGVLSATPSTTPISRQGREAFERGLRELGWIPGRTIRLEYRSVEGKPELLDS
jgi:hypothetical protein